MSLWWCLVDHPVFSPGDLHQHWDVVIVGGGFSGLWSAHHLIQAEPTLKIAILEKDRVGSGASGRNGGWASALYPRSDEKLLRHFDRSIVDSLHLHLRNAIDEIGNFAKEEMIDCGFHKGGTLVVARNAGQMHRLQKDANPENPMLNVEQTHSRIKISGALGSTFTPDCAALNPAALLVGLANSLAHRGVAIFENTFAEISAEKRVHAQGHVVESEFVLRAIEAYHDKTRDQIPIYSLMVATEPLPTSVFDEIGIRNRETFAEDSHLVTYAQRTPDDRLAIGGRGALYTWGSRRNDARENGIKDHQRLRTMARQWFPILTDYQFTHAWGGAVALTRDWAPYVRKIGAYGEMGGYVGDGVTLSYLAAATMADLITGRDSTRTQLPFVQWKNPRWEREPLRWIAVNSAIKLSSLADKEEKLTHRSSLIMKILSSITGQ